MRRVFFDTNVLLDILLKRAPFYPAAARLWLKAEEGEVEGLVSLLSLATVYYLVRKSTEADTARQAIDTISDVLDTVDSPARAGRMALHSRMGDFEDALQYAIATLAEADCVVTRNPKDFPKRGKVPVLTPEEFLKKERVRKQGRES